MCGVDEVEWIVVMFGVDCLFVGLVDFVVSFGYFGDICYLDVEIVMVCVFVVGK